MGLYDRHYWRTAPHPGGRSMTLVLLVVNVAAYCLQNIATRWLDFPVHVWFALSLEGLRHYCFWQLLTFQFLHGGLLHLLLNGLVIYFFGREVEAALDRGRFLLLYFGSGVVGGVVQILAAVLAPAQFGGFVVGASAGAFGLVAAFARLFPERQITLLLFFVFPLTLRAKYLLWGSAILAGLGVLFPGDHIAHAAHLGGMLTGVFFVHHIAHRSWPRFRPRVLRPAPPEMASVSSRRAWGRPSTGSLDELPPDEFISREVDPILDKISAHGIHSLTPRERQILEAARQKMVKR